MFEYDDDLESETKRWCVVESIEKLLRSLTLRQKKADKALASSHVVTGHDSKCGISRLYITGDTRKPPQSQ